MAKHNDSPHLSQEIPITANPEPNERFNLNLSNTVSSTNRHNQNNLLISTPTLLRSLDNYNNYDNYENNIINYVNANHSEKDFDIQSMELNSPQQYEVKIT